MVDLVAVQQQLARAHRVGVHVGGGREQRREVRPEEVELAPAGDDVALLDAGAPGAQRLDLPPLQGEPRLDLLLDGVVVACLPVFRDGAGRAFFLFGHERAVSMALCAGAAGRPALVRDTAGVRLSK